MKREPLLVGLALAALLLPLPACEKDPGGQADAGPPVPNCEVDPPLPEAERRVGPHPEGGYVLVGGQRLTPAGRLTPLDGMPINITPLPSGEHLLATEAGWRRPHKLWLLDAFTGDVLFTDTREQYFYGLAATRDGTRIYVGGGDTHQVWVYDLDRAAGTLIDRDPIDVGVAYVGAVALSPDESILYVADNETKDIHYHDAVTGAPLGEVLVGDQPYDLKVDAARNQLAVSLWGESEVVFVDLATHTVLGEVTTGKNPEVMLLGPDGDRLYVANSDSDTVSVVDLATRTLIETVSIRIWHPTLRGLSPNHLALSPDEQRLLVTSPGVNAIEVFDLATLDHLGSIPTGWYPAALAFSPATEELYVLNMKGVGAGPSEGDQPSDLMRGNLQITTLPDAAGLAAGRDAVIANSSRMLELEPTLTCDATPGVFPVPVALGMPTPIEHVVLIVRENKTYAVELGDTDLEDADADPSLCTFGEWYTPNLHQLVREFAHLDNFYTNGEVSIQGHHWLTAIMNNDYYEKAVMVGQGHGRSAGDFAATKIGWPEGGFIWGYLSEQGVDFVNYGEGDGAPAHDLIGLDWDYPGIFFNMNERDVDKAAYVIGRIQDGYMPRFTFIGLPNNHTAGTKPGAWTPESMIADNDEATGMLVEAISHSPFWPRTVIIIVEDDAQQGGDHVETHRSPALIISPWAKRGHVSHVLGDFPAVWKTIWLILGLPPMGLFDATAAAMYEPFTSVPDYTPYTYLP
jgi:YVTN family beta-propeller protein